MNRLFFCIFLTLILSLNNFVFAKDSLFTKELFFKNLEKNKVELYFVDPLKNKKPKNACENEACLSLLYLIENAKESIDFAIYGIGRQDAIFNALIDAQKRGVLVRGVVDMDSKNINPYKDTKKLISKLKTVKTDYKDSSTFQPKKEDYIQQIEYNINGEVIKTAFINKDIKNYNESIMHNKYFIIDTGRAGYKGSKAQANSIIIKYLKDKGIKNIESLIITHFDNDHSGGAVDIMKNLKVKKVYINSFDDKSMTSINIYKTLKELEIPVQIPHNNKSIYSENNLNIQNYIASSKEDNEKSLMTLLTYKNFDMLFTGDAGTGAFNKLKKDIPHNIEILKVGHHGGSNVVNYEMLNHLKPTISIISTGPNAFGHPNKGTLDILRKTDIYRTDRNNSIKITSDGNNYLVYTFDTYRKKYIKSKEFTAY